MGIDARFDMVPHLSDEPSDQRSWESFLDKVIDFYQDDKLVEVKSNYTVFQAGEHPRPPSQGYKFLRFSSKTSGGHAKVMQNYIDDVARIAKDSFGSRIYCWDEGAEVGGFHSWLEVNNSSTSDEQTDKREIQISTIRNNQENRLDDVCPVSGKGKGLVARVGNIKGTRILSEKPLIVARNIFPIELMEIQIAAQLRTITKDQQRQVFSLHNNFPGKFPFSGIMRTISLPCGVDSAVGGVYQDICRINHDCLPNAHHSWNREKGQETIHAVQHIPAGCEITISYNQGGTTKVRQAHLKSFFGFDCQCSLCSLPLPEQRVSDARRVEMQSLDDAIGDSSRMMNDPATCINDCCSLLQRLEEEYGGSAYALKARLFYDAFQISIIHDDQARASVFARMAHACRVTCEGRDSPETRTVENLMTDPRRHATFGTSHRWSTTKAVIPKKLSDDAFERWLWSRGREDSM